MIVHQESDAEVEETYIAVRKRGKDKNSGNNSGKHPNITPLFVKRGKGFTSLGNRGSLVYNDVP